ncbi:hypothetical protein ACEPAG_4743 [Sanghuangporus baumii]
MIVDGKIDSVEELELPTEAPPAYDELDFPNTQLVTSNSSSDRIPSSRPSHRLSRRNRPTPVTNRNTTASRSAGQKLNRPIPSFAPSPPKRDKPSSSVPPSAKTQADVREIVRGLLRDVVQGSSPVRSSASAALGVLQSCATACSRHSISFARILQERSIEHHAPLYWAIVSRPPGNEGPSKIDDREDDAFLVELFAHAAPLTPISVEELRAACLVVSNNVLFQRLRSVPGALPLSGADRMLLSSTSLQIPAGASQNNLEKASLRPETKQLHGFNDTVTVCEGETGSNSSTFSVNFQFRLFQRRMRVSGILETEFIARGRLWQLIFFVVPPISSRDASPSSCKGGQAPAKLSTTSVPPPILASARSRRLSPGTWALALALLGGSAQCYAEACFIVSLPGKEKDLDRSRHSFPSHSYATALPASGTGLNPPDTDIPPLLSSHSSARPNTEAKSSKRSFFRRTGSDDKTKWKTRPSIILNLRSSITSPLIAMPTPSWNESSMLSPEELSDLSPDALKSMRRRPTREEKRVARKVAAKERREREGRESKKDLKERARLAETVILVGFEEVSAVEKGGKKEQTVKPEELMYDGCPYVSPDGTLRASLEVRLSNSPLESKYSDCVIC